MYFRAHVDVFTPRLPTGSVPFRSTLLSNAVAQHILGKFDSLAKVVEVYAHCQSNVASSIIRTLEWALLGAQLNVVVRCLPLAAGSVAFFTAVYVKLLQSHRNTEAVP